MRAAPEEAFPAFRDIARENSRRVDIAKPSFGYQVPIIADQDEFRVNLVWGGLLLAEDSAAPQGHRRPSPAPHCFEKQGDDAWHPRIEVIR